MAAVDPAKLQRVVMNLLSNAFKFAPAGRRGARAMLARRATSWPLSVEDSGPGVQPELRKAIFERFRQVDGGANRQVSGTGLGLRNRPRVRRDAPGHASRWRIPISAGRVSK